MRLRPRFEDLKRRILAKVPHATVTGATGRTRSFEVEINGVAVYSKLKNDRFPNFEEVVTRVLEASEGKPVQPVTGTQ
uniref:Putative selenoprotein w 2a n=1 Tax=Amblyomma cajennense TaxID=34607 RepID=A0A023FDL5_AMBCJ